jgi:exopolysaccharide biosynthesis polyprenyl glycosylphosphotransferase
MIRILHAHFPTRTVFLGISEACLIAFAFVLATIARLGPNDGSIVLSYEQGFVKILIVAVAFIVCMYYFDLYDSLVLHNPREVHTRLIQMYGTVSILLAGFYYLYPPLELGRGVFLIGFISVPILLLIWRHLFLRLSSLSLFAERVLILGDGPLTESLAAELKDRPILGIKVVGQLKSFEHANGGFASASSEERLQAIVSSIKAHEPDRIIVASPDWRGDVPLNALLELNSRGISIQDGREAYEAVTGKIPLEALGLNRLLFSVGFRVSRPLVLYKRTASIIVSAIGLLLTLPLMALIALAIRLDSEGPIIFRQKRVGQGGRTFVLYKFRTMLVDANQDDNYPPTEIMDRRFTRVGRWLRRTRLDEIPQFFNILIGDMHFIGPRPFVPNQEEECAGRIPFYRHRWVVKPGATGWAQVNRGYNVTIEDNREKLAYDLFYIKNISVGLDLLILIMTAKILLLGRGSR